MSGFHWFLVGWWTLNGLGSVFFIGRERPPITPSTAMAMVVLYAALILWTVHS